MRIWYCFRDISWALKLKEAVIDLERIDQLPGNKLIVKGIMILVAGTQKAKGVRVRKY